VLLSDLLRARASDVHIARHAHTTCRTGEGSGVHNKTIKARRTDIKTTFTEHRWGFEECWNGVRMVL
jgi:hypothetical protein